MTLTPTDNLTAADEARLITDAQAGNERAMERLLDAYAPAIEQAARRFQNDMEWDDAVQEARAAFITCVYEHDFDKADRLSWYIKRYLGFAMAEVVSDASNQWGIPDRTLRLFHMIREKADGDLTVGAALAPEYEMASVTFTTIAQMLKVDSLNADEGDRSPIDTQTAPPIGSDTVDPYERVESLIYARSLLSGLTDDEARQIIRYAYGFDEVTLGGEIVPEMSPALSLAAHDDRTVADAMTANPTFDKTYTRPTVQRRRTKALAAMREMADVPA